MKCKFEHDGDCCNNGAVQYMCKCKQPCGTIDPMTNADRIRAMTDEELAVRIEAMCDASECRAVNGSVCPLFHECPMGTMGVKGLTWLEWLKQPYGGAEG